MLKKDGNWYTVARQQWVKRRGDCETEGLAAGIARQQRLKGVGNVPLKEWQLAKLDSNGWEGVATVS